MYFFYFDESGTRDPSVGTNEKPKDHLYVLLAVGMYEGQWRRFDLALSKLKLELANSLKQKGKEHFELTDCEIKSNWVRNERERQRRSPFLHALHPDDLKRLTDAYFQQVVECNMVVVVAVIDKRHLRAYMNAEMLHKKAYELVLERIQHYMREYHPKHKALIVMDDTSKQLNRAVAMKHAFFQRSGNQNMTFPDIVEYPFFTRSELSNGVQLADLLAYNVYRAFRNEDLTYSYFDILLPSVYKGRDAKSLHGLKIWPESSSLAELARSTWNAYKRKNLLVGD